MPTILNIGLASGYLNQPEVMEAIHVRDPGFCWAVCNTARGWKYQVSLGSWDPAPCVGYVCLVV